MHPHIVLKRLKCYFSLPPEGFSLTCTESFIKYLSTKKIRLWYIIMVLLCCKVIAKQPILS